MCTAHVLFPLSPGSGQCPKLVFWRGEMMQSGRAVSGPMKDPWPDLVAPHMRGVWDVLFVISFWQLGVVCYLNTTQPIMMNPKLTRCPTWGRKAILGWWESAYVNENSLLQGHDLVNVTRLQSGQVNNRHDKNNYKRWSQTSTIREQAGSN